MDRHVRQRALAAVGDAGQVRIERKSYAVGSSGRASQIERCYLERAGARHFAATVDAPPFAHAAVFQHPVARDFAAGAWRALGQLRRALEQDP